MALDTHGEKWAHPRLFLCRSGCTVRLAGSWPISNLIKFNDCYQIVWFFKGRFFNPLPSLPAAVGLQYIISTVLLWLPVYYEHMESLITSSQIAILSRLTLGVEHLFHMRRSLVFIALCYFLSFKICYTF